MEIGEIMIVENWSPKTKVINGKQVKILYVICDNPNSNTLTTWKCDDPNCKTPQHIHTIRYGHLKSGMSSQCNLDIQICKSCQLRGAKNPMYGKTHTDDVKDLLRINIQKSVDTIKKKYNVDNISKLDIVKNKKKQFIINFDSVSKLVSIDGYKLLRIRGNNKYAILDLMCPNNHVFSMKYESWKRGCRCKECFYDILRNAGIENKEGFEKYKNLVRRETRKTIRKYDKIINPNNLTLGRTLYHIDHKYSILEGYKNNIDYKIISSLHNLEIILGRDNCSKQNKCSITKEVLLGEYFRKN
jgi:hypothetical protein